MSDRISEALAKVEPHILAVSVINLDNLAKNYAEIQSRIGNVQIGSVMKADSYGFGAVPISKRLYKEGCRQFFVATIAEGIAIREVLESDAQILVLSGPLDNTEDTLISHNLTPVLNGIYQADLWINCAKKLKRKLDAVVHVDTGMCRNGFSPEDVVAYYEKITNYLSVSFVMSHLACADVPEHKKNVEQLHKFKSILRILGNPKGSLSATYGFFLGKDYLFDLIRPGKTLYGIAIRDDKIGSMLPVADIFSRIVQINSLKAGETVGYGATFKAVRDMKTITLGIGYADGFMRKFSGFGCGFLGGKKIPMIGRISMDYLVLDASDVDESLLKIGNWVALTRTPDYTLEKWAMELGTLPYEVACRFGQRVKRVYLGEA
ncbi:MAG: alanine racemase [Holosporaceae bacterium]|jgi:alanine racemase|nr:alanine racemase [Holosporaceae bacterium]